MPLSIRLGSSLEARVDEEARRRGVTKFAAVRDALERVLSPKNPRVLLDQVHRTPMHRPDASTATGAALKAKLRSRNAS